MENSRFFKLVIIVLLLINIGTLAFMWMRQQYGGAFPSRREDTFTFLTRELQLNHDQQRQYEQMRDRHHEAMESINRHNHDLHEQFFHLLASSTADSILVRHLADSIAINQRQMEMITFDHFKQVRSICTLDQKKKFDEVINEAMRMMAPKPPPPR